MDAPAAATSASTTSNALSSIAALFSKRASVLGLITLEDVIEVLLTEQVYDESDKKLATERLVTWMRSVAVPALRSRISSSRAPTPSAAAVGAAGTEAIEPDGRGGNNNNNPSTSAAARRVNGAAAAAPAARGKPLLTRAPSLREQLRQHLNDGAGGDGSEGESAPLAGLAGAAEAGRARGSSQGAASSGGRGGGGGGGARIRRAFSERRQQAEWAAGDGEAQWNTGGGKSRDGGGGAAARTPAGKRYMKSASGAAKEYKEPLLSAKGSKTQSYGSDDE